MSSSKVFQESPLPSVKEGLRLITQSTPNGKKIQIALEELKEAFGTEFGYDLIDITTNIQKEPWFLAYGSNGRIPVLIDYSRKPATLPSPITVQESGAILLYLAKNYDKGDKFGFEDADERNQCIQWLFFQNAGVGPMQGQLNHFGKFAKEKLPYAIERYHNETLRLYGVIEDHLTGKYTGFPPREYLAGAGKGKYSWADMSMFPWVNAAEFSGISKEELSKFPALLAWVERVKQRPAVQKGLNDYNLPGK